MLGLKFLTFLFACVVAGVSKTTELIISNLLQDNKIEWQARPAQ